MNRYKVAVGRAVNVERSECESRHDKLKSY